MKTPLILFLLLCSTSVWAGDSLTVAQVYNFNIGDTLDYEYYTHDNDILVFGYNFLRLIVVQKTYNAAHDTLRYYFAQPGGQISDSLLVPELDSIAVFKLPPVYQGCYSTGYTLNDTVSYPGYLSNDFAQWCTGYRDTDIYTQGLGQTYSSQYVETGSGDGLNIYTRRLIYYANSTTHIGTPYYVANWSTTIKYIPLPEECAVWTRTIDDTTVVGPSGYTAIAEQIRTGNKYPKNGFNYVELICRIENYTINRFTPDSVIGYFYNDSLAQTAYFVTDTDSIASQVLCPFNITFGTQCSSEGYYTLDSVYINNGYRTRWTCSPLGPGDPNEDIIAGIGYLTGLIHIDTYYAGPYPADGELSCFSVCGETLYPILSTGDCSLISAIDPLYNAFALNIFPSVTSGELNIEQSVANQLNYAIYDVSGRQVVSGKFNAALTKLDLSALASGMYIIRFSAGGDTANRRFVIAH